MYERYPAFVIAFERVTFADQPLPDVLAQLIVTTDLVSFAARLTKLSGGFAGEAIEFPPKLGAAGKSVEDFEVVGERTEAVGEPGNTKFHGASGTWSN
jgi:hypothetical protein